MKIISHTVKPRFDPLYRPSKRWPTISGSLGIFRGYHALHCLDYEVWLQSNQNPARMLGMVAQERYDELAQDDSYAAALKAVEERFERYKNGETWYKGEHNGMVAYFSMEYGLHGCHPDLLGRLGHSFGRPHEGRERHGPPACRRRAAV